MCQDSCVCQCTRTADSQTRKPKMTKETSETGIIRKYVPSLSQVATTISCITSSPPYFPITIKQRFCHDRISHVSHKQSWHTNHRSWQVISRDVRGKEREKTGTGKKLERTRFFPFPFLQILTSANLYCQLCAPISLSSDTCFLFCFLLRIALFFARL